MVSVQPVRIVGQLPRVRCEQGDLWPTQLGIPSHWNKCLIAKVNALQDVLSTGGAPRSGREPVGAKRPKWCDKELRPLFGSLLGVDGEFSR